jgi:hypothetical protein
MSYEASSWARSVKAGSASNKLILLCLAERCNAQSGSCTPSQATLAAEAEVCKKTVERALSSLQASSLISRERRCRGDGSRTSDRIILTGYLAAKRDAELEGKVVPIRSSQERQNASQSGSNWEPNYSENEESLTDIVSDLTDIESNQTDSVSAFGTSLTDTESGLTSFEPVSKNTIMLMTPADAREQIEKCYSRAGPRLADRHKSQSLVLSQREIFRWLQHGCDPDFDILPTIEAMSSIGSNSQINSWKYFTDAVLKARDDRLSPLPQPARNLEKAHDPAANENSRRRSSTRHTRSARQSAASITDLCVGMYADTFAEHALS